MPLKHESTMTCDTFSRRRRFEFFWVVTPCGVVAGYRRFGVPCCLHPRMDFGGLHCLQPRMDFGGLHCLHPRTDFGGLCCLHPRMDFGGPCCFHPKDGGSRVLRNDRILPQHYVGLQPKRPRLELYQLQC